MARQDYAVFDGDRFVTNALLEPQDVERMERDGYRCVGAEAVDRWQLPAFRGRRYATGQRPNRRRWYRD